MLKDNGPVRARACDAGAVDGDFAFVGFARLSAPSSAPGAYGPDGPGARPSGPGELSAACPSAQASRQTQAV